MVRILHAGTFRVIVHPFKHDYLPAKYFEYPENTLVGVLGKTSAKVWDLMAIKPSYDLENDEIVIPVEVANGMGIMDNHLIVIFYV